jgi:DNA-directed RNA polymerase specialized sigma24 family protein
MLTQTDEQELSELFIRQEHLQLRSEAYYSNREIITQKLLPKIKTEMQKAQYSWQHRFNLDAAECESLMYESLLLAIDSYQISRGKCKFMSFFWTVVSQVFKNYLSKIYAQKRTPRMQNTDIFSSVCSLSYPITSNKDETISLSDLISEDFTTDKRLNHRFLLEQIYKNATLKQKRVLKRLFIGKSYSEVGKALHMSPSDICNIVKQLREKYLSLNNQL